MTDDFSKCDNGNMVNIKIITISYVLKIYNGSFIGKMMCLKFALKEGLGEVSGVCADGHDWPQLTATGDT